MLKEAEFDIASPKFRDSYLAELASRGQDNSRLYRELKAWKDVATDRSMDKEIAVGRKAFTNLFRARLHIRRSSSRYEQFRRDFSNSYIKRSREQLQDIIEANC